MVLPLVSCFFFYDHSMESMSTINLYGQLLTLMVLCMVIQCFSSFSIMAFYETLVFFHYSIKLIFALNIILYFEATLFFKTQDIPHIQTSCSQSRLLISSVTDIPTFLSHPCFFLFNILGISLKTLFSNSFVSYLWNGALWFKWLKGWILVQFLQCMKNRKGDNGPQVFHNLHHNMFEWKACLES